MPFISTTDAVMVIPLHKDCALIGSHACGLLAVDKASGVVSHPNRNSADTNALIPLPYDHDREAYSDGKNQWFLLNRLDGPTSGVILLANDPEVAATAKTVFANHLVAKSYAAVVKGIPPRKKEVIKTS